MVNLQRFVVKNGKIMYISESQFEARERERQNLSFSAANMQPQAEDTRANSQSPCLDLMSVSPSPSEDGWPEPANATESTHLMHISVTPLDKDNQTLNKSESANVAETITVADFTDIPVTPLDKDNQALKKTESANASEIVPDNDDEIEIFWSCESSDLQTSDEEDVEINVDEENPPELYPFDMDPYIEKLNTPTLSPQCIMTFMEDIKTEPEEISEPECLVTCIEDIKTEPQEINEIDVDSDFPIDHDQWFEQEESGGRRRHKDIELIDLTLDETARLMWCKLCDYYYKDIDCLKYHIRFDHHVEDLSRLNAHTVATWDLNL